ncbi:MAG: hypothetical protein J6V72_02415 [Kiritimatiellae bacterium]|nr:hypothetical protein [Kiritimatiellia bacterium]
MTSYRLSELPIPSRSAGMSAAGNRFDAVEPPVPPEPPTPGHGTEYVTAKLTLEDDAYYADTFSLAEHADDFAAKQVGDEVVITIDGVDYASSITELDESGSWIDIYFDAPDGSGITLMYLTMTSEGGAVQYDQINMMSENDYPDGVTVTIADPA